MDGCGGCASSRGAQEFVRDILSTLSFPLADEGVPHSANPTRRIFRSGALGLPPLPTPLAKVIRLASISSHPTRQSDRPNTCLASGVPLAKFQEQTLARRVGHGSDPTLQFKVTRPVGSLSGGPADGGPKTRVGGPSELFPVEDKNPIGLPNLRALVRISKV